MAVAGTPTVAGRVEGVACAYRLERLGQVELRFEPETGRWRPTKLPKIKNLRAGLRAKSPIAPWSADLVQAFGSSEPLPERPKQEASPSTTVIEVCS